MLTSVSFVGLLDGTSVAVLLVGEMLVVGNCEGAGVATGVSEPCGI